MRRRAPLLAALVLALAAPRVAAQGSPNVALDDPRLPLLEFLIQRGTMRDPSPMLRPFRRADVVAALERADTSGGRDAALVVRMLSEFRDLDATARWEAEGRAGAQAFTRARRDLLYPAGVAAIRPYFDARLEGVFGPIVAVSRLAMEQRVSDDPDWRGRTDLQATFRMVEAYLGAQFKWGRFWYGQFDQQWGPVGQPGIALSNFSYPRNYFGLDVGSRTVRLQAQAGTLRDETDSTGAIIKRYHFGHRLAVRFSDRVQAALWETTVYSGEDRSMQGSFLNPLSFLFLANQYGDGDDGNVMIGVDASWRPFRGTTFQAQFALDDFQYQDRSGPNRYPDRWAFTLTAFGPVGRTLSWQALYTQASTLAFRSVSPFDNYVDADVGIGRGFPDMDRLAVAVTVPVATRFTVTPDVTLQRQGAARLTDPFPTPDQAGATPAFLSDPVETTWRVGFTLSGRTGPLDLQAVAGVHHRINADNIAGTSSTRFEGRIQATLGLRGRGILD